MPVTPARRGRKVIRDKLNNSSSSNSDNGNELAGEQATKNIPVYNMIQDCSIQLLKTDLASLQLSLPTKIRQSSRNRTKPKTYAEYVSPTKRQGKISRTVSSSEDEEDVMESCPKKATALFSNDDIEGQDMFKFKSRHTKLDLQNKVQSTVYNSANKNSSPSVTPNKAALPLGLTKRILFESTPKHVKDKIKKRIIREVESDQSGSDFSGSSSDFVPDKTDESDSSASEEESPDKCTRVQIKRPQESSTKLKRDTDYVVTPDSYFMLHSLKKVTTSDHTLERLKNTNFGDDDFLNMQNETHLSEEHSKQTQMLNMTHEHLFNKWLYVLGENYNVLLYGLGSKRPILQKFQSTKLKNFPSVVINGFFPSLTMKSILESIIVDLLECTLVPANIWDIVSLIDTQLTERDIELFLIIHNIDGAMLRNSKAQTILTSISQIKNVHTIATIDHINAPLIWDHSKMSKFNFTWWDVTTFLPYKEETSYENLLMSHKSGTLQLSSLRSVYQSLTSNAKGIFNILTQNQLDHQKKSNYQGLPFKDLYSKSREQFLVSSDTALRAQLTEFLDHKLVRMKRSVDGSENLVIPMDSTLLQQFLDQQS